MMEYTEGEYQRQFWGVYFVIMHEWLEGRLLDLGIKTEPEKSPHILMLRCCYEACEISLSGNELETTKIIQDLVYTALAEPEINIYEKYKDPLKELIPYWKELANQTLAKSFEKGA